MSKHMTLDIRQVILLGLECRESFAQIAQKIGKAPSSVSREVRNHRIVSNTSAFGRIPNRCIHRFSCDRYCDCSPCEKPKLSQCRQCRFCNQRCGAFKEEQCVRLSQPPYVCNGCLERRSCTLRKFLYDPAYADNEYHITLSESREGFNLTEREVQEIDLLVSPLLRKGQSVHHIVVHHKAELTVSEQTIERLIDACALSFKPEEQRRKYKIKPRRTKQKEVKVDRKCRIGRNIEAYQAFIQEKPQASLVQMDTVIGTVGGKCLFTLIFVNCSLMLAFLCEHNNAATICSKMEALYGFLGKELFCRLFSVLLTDNGSEFSQPAALELAPDRSRRANVFYCDPYASYQKGTIERNHEFVRLILPKGTSFDSLTQTQISLLLSHINSYSRPSLQDKTPFEMFSFLYGEQALHSLIEFCQLSIIPPDDIVLTPALLHAD